LNSAPSGTIVLISVFVFLITFSVKSSIKKLSNR
jgi:hypothetical protein